MLVSLYFCCTPRFDKEFHFTNTSSGPVHPWYFCRAYICMHCHSIRMRVHQMLIASWLCCLQYASKRWLERKWPSQSNGGCGQGKGRGQDQNCAPVSAADLDAELDKYHAEAVKENWSYLLFYLYSGRAQWVWPFELETLKLVALLVLLVDFLFGRWWKNHDV
jgi:hypothetical protein